MTGARVETIGREARPVIVIDDFAPRWQDLRAMALRTPHAAMPGHYPGVRAEVPPALAQALARSLEGLIAQVFGLPGPCDVLAALWSVVATPPGALTAIQRLPHFDGLEPERIALVLFLCEAHHGGTAFYRHRATGFETVDPARHAAYDAALQDDVARHGLPQADYIRGDTALFEQIARFAAAPNRALIYRSNALHCADLPPDAAFDPDPATGRLTLNAFLRGCAGQ